MEKSIGGFYKLIGTALLLLSFFISNTSFSSAAEIGVTPTSLPPSQLPFNTVGIVSAPQQKVLGENGYHFARTLTTGSTGEDVLRLQKWLNTNGYLIAPFGPGSPGHETSTFGRGTANALIRLQEANAGAILAPSGLTKGTGRFANATRAFVNALLEKAHDTGTVLGITDPQSFWTNSDTPSVASEADYVAVELGLKFRPQVSGTVTGMKFYKGSQNTGTHVGTLWTSEGTKLAEGTFTNESSSGWQTLMFSSPVSVQANTTYVVSYNAPNGRYSTDYYYFTNSRTSGDLVAPSNAGVYAYGGKMFPDQTWNASNYWVDVLFSVADTTTPSSGSSILGYNQVGSTLDYNDQDSINATKFTVSSSNMTVNSMSVYMKNIVAAPNNQYQMAIYNDSNGTPGSLVASTTTGTLSANSWNSLPISATLSANKSYWLAYNTNGDNNLSYATTNSPQSAYRSTSFGTWPSTLTATGTQNSKFSIYASGATVTTPPPSTSDTTRPSVSFTAPASNATVSGTAVTISADASDNVGVAGVQFKIGSTNIGAEDTEAPYSVVWDSTTVSNRSKTITAVARDAAGNTRSVSRSIKVNNVTTPPPSGDTTAPSVSFSAPTEGSTVSGSAVTVSASASDNVGVVGVQFKLGTQFLGAEDTSAPYSISWNTTVTANGTYTLSAIARDAAGNTTTATRTVVINNYVPPAPDTTAPSVSFSAPTEGSTISGSAVALSATASDNVGVVGVTFKYGTSSGSVTNLIGAEDTTSPYSINWNTIGVPNGTYYLTATARDAAGNVSLSTRTVVINNPLPDTTAPSVSLAVPSGTLSGTVTLSATASDNVGVARVEFYNGSALLGSDTSSPYSFSWNTTAVANGTYSISAKAFDTAGNVGTSSILSVAVNNTVVPPPPSSGNLTAVVTYESIGLYMPRSSAMGSATSANVRYKQTGTSAWKEALPLWYDSRTNLGTDAQFRGSILNVEPGTSYDVEVYIGSTVYGSGTFVTWSNTQPIGQTITLPASSSTTLNITASGSPSGYILYTAASGGSTIDMGFAQANSNNCINVSGSYIIIRGLTLKNCQSSAVELKSGAHDVIIEGNDMYGFGHGPGGAIQGETGTIIVGDTESAAVSCTGYNYGSAKPYRITVQGNKIHDPRYGANPWSYGHPDSANAIGFFECGGNNVFRWNDVYSSQGHYYMDGIGGSDNFTATGFPNYDSDIYGNHISQVYDDGIEAEGGNRNVRIWGNYITGPYIGIAQGTVTNGPIYTYRNINSSHGGSYDPSVTNPDNESERGNFFKLGSQSSTYVGGKAYYFNNTTLQPACPSGTGATKPCGTNSYMENSAGSVLAKNIEDANNIVSSFKGSSATPLGYLISSSSGTFSNDLVLGGTTVTVTNKISGSPIFAGNVDEGLTLRTFTGSGSVRATRGYFATRSGNDIGNFSLASNSPGKGAAKVIPNITDMYSSPDVGAHQSGTPNMKFGTALWNGTKAWSNTPAPSDTTAPSVSLAVPSGTLSGTVTLSATASDNVGVARVEFYNGSALLGSDTSSPYSFSWNTTAVANGTYSISAKAFDTAGNVGTSSILSVAVNNTTIPGPDTTVPTVSFSAPASGATVSGTVTLSATASDNIGIASVVFRTGSATGTIIGTGVASGSTYSFSWNTTAVANGAYTVYAVALDTSGNIASVSRSLTVNNTISSNTCANAPSYSGYSLAYCTDYNASSDITNSQLGAGSISTTQYVSPTGSFKSSVPAGSGPISSGYRSEVQYGEDLSPNDVPIIVEYDTRFESIPTDGLSQQWHGNVQGTSGQLSLWIGGQEFMVERSTCGGSGCGNIYQTGSASGGGLWNIELNKWYHMKWDIKFTSANTGWVRLYIDGTLYYDSGITKTADGQGQYMKTGQNLFSSPTGNSVVYVDNLRVYKSSGNTAPDTTSPTVSLAVPSGTLSGTVNLLGTATDNIGVSRVEFYRGSTLLGTDTSSPYSFSWDTTTVANGTYALTAKAFDAAGNSATSASLSATVNNTVTPPPTNASYQGFGAQAVGGPTSGSGVCHVTTVSNTALQNCLGSNKTVMIDVAGSFTKQLLFDANNPVSYLTIDGSNAPGPVIFEGVNDDDGIIALEGTMIHHIVIKGITVRNNKSGDGINVADGAHDILITNVASYGNGDGNIDIAGDNSGQTKNVTVQYSVLGQGCTGTGCANGSDLWSGSMLITGQNASVHHNLFSPVTPGGIAERNPLVHSNYSPVGSPNADFRNNVVWKWGRDGGTGSGYGTDIAYNATANVVNNYYYSTASPSDAVDNGAYGEPKGKLYAAGNVSGNSGVNANSASNVGEYTIPSWAQVSTESACVAAAAVKQSAGPAQKDSYTQGLLNALTLPGCSGGTGDTTAPSVSLAVPSGTLSGTVTLSATASDNVGVARVEFYRGSTLLGSDTSSPYSFSWNTTTVTNGSYSITAKAFDAAGNSATSSALTVSVNNAPVSTGDTTVPTVTWSGPAGASILSGTVTLSATATDNVGVAGVTFKYGTSSSAVNTTVGSEDTSSPYSVSWNTTAVTNGTYYLTATARDAAGNIKTSNPISVTVTNTTGSTGSYTLVWSTGYDSSADINTNQGPLNSISTTIYKTGPGSYRSEASGSTNVSSGYRGEMQYDGSLQNPKEGAIEYDTYFQNWNDHGWGGSCIQWHPNNGGSSNLFLYCSEGKFNVTRSMFGANYYQNNSTSYGTSIVPNQWYHLRWEFNWSTNTSTTSGDIGYARLYINDQLYYSYTGRTQDDDGQPYLKIGQNRWGTVDPATVVYYDNVKIYKKN